MKSLALLLFALIVCVFCLEGARCHDKDDDNNSFRIFRDKNVLHRLRRISKARVADATAEERLQPFIKMAGNKYEAPKDVLMGSAHRLLRKHIAAKLQSNSQNKNEKLD